MKEVTKEDLARVHGGTDQPATDADILPCPVATTPTMAIADGSTLPPTFTQKQVES